MKRSAKTCGPHGTTTNAATAMAVFLGALLFLSADARAQMSVGVNLWCIAWGSSIGGGLPYYNYWARNVDWTTTTNPWNPTFIQELEEGKFTCIRFMDWGLVNGGAAVTWDERIPKTANHYLRENGRMTDFGDIGYGVAYEWMIDLCNRVGADMWVCVPAKADTNYSYQLAVLVRDNLDPALKVYIEYSNECWNDGFPQTHWMDAQTKVVGLPNPVGGWQNRVIYGFGSGGSCRWSEYVYHACRAMNQFNKAFGTNSPRVVKTLCGQMGWDWGGDYNSQVGYHMACLLTTICNPWNVKIDAYGAAPYYEGNSESDMRANLAISVHCLQNVRAALAGSGIPLVCYEAGPDNFATTNLQGSPFQEQLTIDALNGYQSQLQGVCCWYTYIGGCWGLKLQTGDDPAISPKWRGYMTWLGAQTAAQEPVAAASAPRTNRRDLPGVYTLMGEKVASGTRRPMVQGILVTRP